MASKKPKDEPPKEEPVNIVAEEPEITDTEADDKAKVVDILLCILCDKQIRVPKCLPCLHSFCEPCLTKYVEKIIKDSPGKIEIHCPECKMMVFQTLGKLNAKSYAENLPIGTVCSTLLCEPAIEQKVCHFNDGCTREAVKWCGYCANALCFDHMDLHRQLTTMKIYHPTTDLQDATKLRFPYQKCVHHPKEDMAYFCPRDWTTTCNICGKIQHRTCYFLNKGVLQISEVAPEIKGNHTTKELDPKLDFLETESQELSDDRKRNLQRLDEQLQMGKDNISIFRKVMDEYLDEIEQNLNGELESKYEKVKSDLENEKMIIDTRLRTVKYYKLMLEAIHSKSTSLQSVTELAKLREQTENINCDIQQRKRTLKRTNLSVQPVHDLEKALPKMGSVHIKEFGRNLGLGHWSLRRSKSTLYN